MKDLLLQTAIGAVDNMGTVDDSGEDLTESIKIILSAVIGVLGLVCVVVMIIGGINYMTSTGDAGKVKKAKDTILYGLIGLIVCVLAFALVQFVINILVNN